MPGPLTQPCACTLAGAQTSSHRVPFPRRGRRREEAQGLRSSLPQAGESLRISLGTGPRFVGEAASEGCPCRDERAGRAPDLVRHEAASLSHSDSSLSMLHHARDSSRQAAASELAAQLRRAAAESELVPAWAPLARLLSNQVRPLLLGNGECPQIIRGGSAPQGGTTPELNRTPNRKADPGNPIRNFRCVCPPRAAGQHR